MLVVVTTKNRSLVYDDFDIIIINNVIPPKQSFYLPPILIIIILSSFLNNNKRAFNLLLLGRSFKYYKTLLQEVPFFIVHRAEYMRSTVYSSILYIIHYTPQVQQKCMISKRLFNTEVEHSQAHTPCSIQLQITHHRRPIMLKQLLQYHFDITGSRLFSFSQKQTPLYI